MVTRPALALLASLLVLGCQPPEPKQVYLDAGVWRPLTVEKGTIINIDLTSRASAGYIWELDKPVTKLKEIEPTSQPYEKEIDPEILSMPGRPEAIRFAFKAIKPGKEVLTIRSCRIGNAKSPKDDKWEAEINVK